jgi:hypothetical protein
VVSGAVSTWQPSQLRRLPRPFGARNDDKGDLEATSEEMGRGNTRAPTALNLNLHLKVHP